jgi:hypothetical protein
MRGVLRRVVIGLLLLAAVGAFYLAGRNGNTDPPVADTSGAVEEFFPQPNSPSVLRQAEVGLDLADGWTGELTIDGVFIPEDQIRRNEPLNQLYFMPGEGKEIEQLDGRVLVVANIWKFADGETRDQARQVSWSFTVL